MRLQERQCSLPPPLTRVRRLALCAGAFLAPSVFLGSFGCFPFHLGPPGLPGSVRRSSVSRQPLPVLVVSRSFPAFGKLPGQLTLPPRGVGTAVSPSGTQLDSPVRGRYIEIRASKTDHFPHGFQPGSQADAREPALNQARTVAGAIAADRHLRLYPIRSLSPGLASLTSGALWPTTGPVGVFGGVQPTKIPRPLDGGPMARPESVAPGGAENKPHPLSPALVGAISRPPLSSCGDRR